MACETMADVLPFEIKDLEPELNAELKKYNKMMGGFVSVGSKGYLLPHKYKEVASQIYNLPLRDSDVFVGGFPRSGTHMLQELVWLIVNDLDYQTASSISIRLRYQNLPCFYTRLQPEIIDENKHNPANQKLLDYYYNTEPKVLSDLPNTKPRLIKYHMPISLLPRKVLETSKLVYIARDPRDVVVSLYYLSKRYRPIQFCGDFKQYWNLFKTNKVFPAPYFEHIKEAWELRHHSNMLFLFYEDILKDLPGTLRRVAQFFGKHYTHDQIQQLSQHLSFDSCKNNPQMNGSLLLDLGIMVPDEQGLALVRKGVSGGWRGHFDAEMRAQADQWIARNLRGTDLRFPSMADEQMLRPDIS